MIDFTQWFQSTGSMAYVTLGVVIVYIILVRSLRYRRVDHLQKKYGETPEQFNSLDYKDAQSILGQLGLYECPWMFLAGKDFAFLRVSINLDSFFQRVCQLKPPRHLQYPVFPRHQLAPER